MIQPFIILSNMSIVCNNCNQNNFSSSDGFHVCCNCGLVNDQIMECEYNYEDRTEHQNTDVTNIDITLMDMIHRMNIPDCVYDGCKELFLSTRTSSRFIKELMLAIIITEMNNMYGNNLSLRDWSKYFSLQEKKVAKFILKIKNDFDPNDDRRYHSIIHEFTNVYPFSKLDILRIKQNIVHGKNIMRKPNLVVGALICVLSKHNLIDYQINPRDMSKMFSQSSFSKCILELEFALKETIN